MNGHKIDYSFGNKNQWRRWKWNRIHELLTVKGTKPRDAVVLYLAGKDNLDFEVAQRHGFKQCNMISCDTCPEVVASLRRAGVVCIEMDIFRAAAFWGDSPHIDVIDADLCCGFLMAQHSAAQTLTLCGHLLGSVLSVNMLKGRDKYSNEHRERYACNNRAVLFAASMHDAFINGIDGVAWSIPKTEAERELRIRVSKNLIANGCDGMDYRSKTQVMQSAVFRIPASCQCDYSSQTSDRRLIAAAKAVRTTRIQKAA